MILLFLNPTTNFQSFFFHTYQLNDWSHPLSENIFTSCFSLPVFLPTLCPSCRLNPWTTFLPVFTSTMNSTSLMANVIYPLITSLSVISSFYLFPKLQTHILIWVFNISIWMSERHLKHNMFMNKLPIFPSKCTHMGFPLQDNYIHSTVQNKNLKIFILTLFSSFKLHIQFIGKFCWFNHQNISRIELFLTTTTSYIKTIIICGPYLVYLSMYLGLLSCPLM